MLSHCVQSLQMILSKPLGMNYNYLFLLFSLRLFLGALKLAVYKSA